MLAEDIVRLAAQIDKKLEVGGLGLAHNINKLWCQHKGSPLPFDALPGLNVAQKMCEVNV